MAAKGSTGAPTTAAEGFQNIAQAVVAAMSAPDAGPHLKTLETMLKMAIGMTHASAGAKPGAAAQPPPGAAPGGPGGPPSGMGQMVPPGGAGPGAGGPPPGGPSLSGATSQYLNSLIGANA